MSVSKGSNSCSLTSLFCASREELKKLYKYSFSLNFSISAVCSGLCVQVLQQSQLHKFHFKFFRLCGLQFCECASFTAVHKFHCRVAHLSSLWACFLSIFIPRQGDLFLYGTEALICPINRKGSWVGCLGWQRGRARTFFLSNFFLSNLFPLFQIKTD